MSRKVSWFFLTTSELQIFRAPFLAKLEGTAAVAQMTVSRCARSARLTHCKSRFSFPEMSHFMFRCGMLFESCCLRVHGSHTATLPEAGRIKFLRVWSNTTHRTCPC